MLLVTVGHPSSDTQEAGVYMALDMELNWDKVGLRWER